MECYVVDAFAENIFEGNPAAVCVMKNWISDELMQKIAAENNLSETAFTVKEDDGSYHLRWFTPLSEIDLCGHATLATAFVINNFYGSEVKILKFKTMSGELVVVKKEDLFEMDFPSRMPTPFTISEQLIDALGIIPIEAHISRDLVLVLENEEQVLNATPNFSKLREIPDGLGVLITSKSEKYDFVSRCFFPKLNVNEDPVCGSAHTSFIPYWSNILGKKEMIARQVSSRGGKYYFLLHNTQCVLLKFQGTLYLKHEGERVKIAGRAVLFSKAQLQIKFNN